MIELVQNFRKVKICNFQAIEVRTTISNNKPGFSIFKFSNGIEIPVPHSMSINEAIVYMQIEMQQKIYNIKIVSKNKKSWMGIPIVPDENVPEGEMYVGPGSSLKTKYGLIKNEKDSTLSVSTLEDMKRNFESLSKPFYKVPFSLGFSYSTSTTNSLDQESKPLNKETVNNFSAILFKQKITNRIKIEIEKKEKRPEISEYDPLDRLTEILEEDDE
jgi:hypothetical protein